MSTIHTNPIPKGNYHFSCQTPSALKKVVRVALVILIAASITIGAISYCRLIHPNFLYGGIGVGVFSLVALVLSCFEKRSKVAQSGPPLNKDLFVFGYGITSSIQEACTTAIAKLHSTKFQKIGVCRKPGSESYIYFESDGQIKALDFENYPNGSLLVIRMPRGDKDSCQDISKPSFLSHLASCQPKLQNYLARGHQHAGMTLDEYKHFIRHKEFPLRIRDIISGK